MATDRTATFRAVRGKLPGAACAMHHSEVDDLPSTASSSVMHSPNCGPTCAPHGADHLDERLLGHALSDLYDIAEVDAEEHARRPQPEWHFSSENLSQDRCLRSRMDTEGSMRELRATAGEIAAALSEVAEGGAKARAADPAVRRPEPLPDVADEELPVAASLLTPRRMARFVPEVDMADEDLTVAASLEASSPRPRASKEGAPWPCMEWLTAEPCVEAPRLEWLVSEKPAHHRRRGRHGHRRQAEGHRRQAEGFIAAFDSEIGAAPDSCSAWARLSDDAYPSAGASLLRW
mmetsp:Transcript_85017/g.238049  ORF Transcript_85017/g.238049 Transcript_85017/m.238049 type:complete len:291 (-) Transcript_85017:170-1042(-)